MNEVAQHKIYDRNPNVLSKVMEEWRKWVCLCFCVRACLCTCTCKHSLEHLGAATQWLTLCNFTTTTHTNLHWHWDSAERSPARMTSPCGKSQPQKLGPPSCPVHPDAAESSPTLPRQVQTCVHLSPPQSGLAPLLRVPQWLTLQYRERCWFSLKELSFHAQNKMCYCLTHTHAHRKITEKKKKCAIHSFVHC